MASALVSEAGLKNRIDSDLAPTDWQRKIMEARVNGLDAALTAATADEIAAIVTQLLLGFPMQGADETCTKYRAKSYLDALKGFPAWAIDAGCQDWNNGRELTGRENFQYAPTAPVLRKYAEKHAQPARSERHALRRILDARIVNVPTEAQREVMKMGFDELSRDIAKGIERPCLGGIDDDA